MKQVFYSEKTKKYYDTEKECKEAEKALEAEEAEKVKAKEERAADAQKVEDAYKAVLEARRQAAESIKNANAMINTAEQNYYDARRAFVDKYGSFHMTYSNKNGDEELAIGDFNFENLFDLAKLFRIGL